MPCQDVMRLDRLPCNQQPALHSTSPLLFPKVEKTSVYIVLIMMMLMMMMMVVMVIVMVMMMMVMMMMMHMTTFPSAQEIMT
jgi:uncharacterized membrane protein (UPF0182 family)